MNPLFEHDGTTIAWTQVIRIELRIVDHGATVVVRDRFGEVVAGVWPTLPNDTLAIALTPEQDARFDTLDGEAADDYWDEVYDNHPDVVAVRARNDAQLAEARARYVALRDAWTEALHR